MFRQLLFEVHLHLQRLEGPGQLRPDVVERRLVVLAERVQRPVRIPDLIKWRDILGPLFHFGLDHLHHAFLQRLPALFPDVQIQRDGPELRGQQVVAQAVHMLDVRAQVFVDAFQFFGGFGLVVQTPRSQTRLELIFLGEKIGHATCDAPGSQISHLAFWVLVGHRFPVEHGDKVSGGKDDAVL